MLVFLALSARPVPAGEWVAVTTELIEKEKPGYGKLCGVVVNHKTGELIVNLSDLGFYSSKDQGKTWTRLNTQVIKGRTEWPGCLQLDPVGEGKTMVSALVYGAPLGVSTDGGAAWSFMDKKSTHIDWFALDWSDPEHKFVLALKHESGDLLLMSRDGGKSFQEVGKGYGPAWIFDNKTAVVAEAKSKTKPMAGLLRTTDGGQTFQPCATFSTRALPRWHQNALYWLVDGALIVSSDKGATWKKIGDVKDGRYGPIFGKDARHLFVLANAGILESSDGGTTWSKPIELPKELKGVSPLTWMEYDPTHDTLYVMKMTSELYRLERGK
jgi:photosystem II stability/assembly factor-like uncharacterized protein